MFPPIQCSKSSYFTQWLLSEYLNRVNEEAGGSGGGSSSSSSSSSSSEQSSLLLAATTPPPSSPNLQQSKSSSLTTPPNHPHHHQHHHHHHNHNNHHHHNVFTAKHFKHLFSSSSSSSPNNPVSKQQAQQKPNNNEYKNGSSLHSNPQLNPSQDSIKSIEFIQLLALNALEFTAPIYSFINKNKDSPQQQPPTTQQQQQQQKQQSQTQLLHQKTQQQKSSEEPTRKSERKNCKCPSTRSFVQLSGHPGSFAPAGPNTVWKKMPEEPVPPASHNNNNNDRTRSDSVKEGEDKGGGGSGGGLKELLEKLDLRNGGGKGRSEPPALNRRQSIFPIHHQSSIEGGDDDDDDDTTPITVFFNQETEQPTSSSAQQQQQQQQPLLNPKVYNIPTHLLPNETQVYRKVNSTDPPDPLTLIIPKYVTETCYNSQMFLELEDLLTNFSKPNPTIMDIKLGTRTFLESEVRNSKPRPDLYQKLIKVDRNACTEEEHRDGAVTKATYMLFRERQSSSCSLGFRVEGVKIGGGAGGVYSCEEQLDDVNFKVLRDEGEIANVFLRFCKGRASLVDEVVKQLGFVLKNMESSSFFMGHEVIGSSLLFIHDDAVVGVWLIDFAKTFEVGGGGGDVPGAGGRPRLTHRDPWVMGNREDGVLMGVDNILRLFKGLVVTT